MELTSVYRDTHKAERVTFRYKISANSGMNIEYNQKTGAMKLRRSDGRSASPIDEWIHLLEDVRSYPAAEEEQSGSRTA